MDLFIFMQHISAQLAKVAILSSWSWFCCAVFEARELGRAFRYTKISGRTWGGTFGKVHLFVQYSKNEVKLYIS